MNGNLRAALVLTLEDKLTAGLNKIRGLFDQIGQLGRRMGLGGLENGASTLNRTSEAAQGLTRHLNSITAAADRAWGAVKRVGSGVGSSVSNWGSKHFGKGMSRTEAFTAAVSGYSVIKPIQEYADFQNIALHSAITEGMSGPAAQREAKRLMTMFRKDALATSQSSSSIAQAYQDLIQTGLTPQMAEKLLPVHSRAATAYNIAPEALGHAVAALSMNLGIGENDMGGALASMALASKSGRFKVEDFSRFLPGITGNLSKLGMKGRGSADTAFAALETVMKNSADPSTGATNFSDFMSYLTSPMAARSFALESKGMAPQTRALLDQYHISGIDMPQLLANARTQGVDPISAVLGTLQKKLAGLPPDVAAEVLGGFFHNQQARDAALSLLQHSADFLALRTKLGGADAGMLGRDFNTANDAPARKMALFMEQLAQLGQQAGEAFLPILMGINFALGHFLGFLDQLDAMLPGTKDNVLLVAGSMMALYAAAAAIGLIMPAFTAGFAVLSGLFTATLSVLGYLWTALTFVVGGLAAILGVSAAVAAAIIVLVGAFVAAAYDIYANWSEFRGFFETLWQGIKDVIQGFLDFLVGVATLNFDKAIGGLIRMMRGLGEFFGSIFQIIGQLFVDFGSFVNNWTGGALTGAVNGIKAAFSGLVAWFAKLWADIRAPFDALLNAIGGGGLHFLPGLSSTPQLQAPGAAGAGVAPGTTPALAAPVTGHITVGVDPNNGQIRINQAQGSGGLTLANAVLNAGPAVAIP